MKKQILIVSTVGLLGIFGATSSFAMDQQAGEQHEDQAQIKMQKQADIQQSDRLTRNLKSVEDLNGMKIYDANDEEVGKVDGLLIDTESGKVTYLMLSAGGTLGLGANDYPIPWQAVQARADQKGFKINFPSAKLKNAPQGTKITSRDKARKIHEYYGVSPYWEEDQEQIRRYRKDMETEAETEYDADKPDFHDEQEYQERRQYE